MANKSLFQFSNYFHYLIPATRDPTRPNFQNFHADALTFLIGFFGSRSNFEKEKEKKKKRYNFQVRTGTKSNKMREIRYKG